MRAALQPFGNPFQLKRIPKKDSELSVPLW